MKHNFLYLVAIINISLISCVTAENINTKPSLNNKYFDFFKIGKDLSSTIFGWDMILKNSENEEVIFSNCNQLSVYDKNNIIPYEQHRFDLFTADCTAIYKYLNASSFKKSFFPLKITNDFIKSLPANTPPIISRYSYEKHTNKTLSQSYNFVSIEERNNSTHLSTSVEDIYVAIVARGDFDNDGVEDLIATSQWYPKDAFGKFSDLVILSKTGKDKPIEIIWRMNTLE
jgi:hypothetical protein